MGSAVVVSLHTASEPVGAWLAVYTGGRGMFPRAFGWDFESTEVVAPSWHLRGISLGCSWSAGGLLAIEMKMGKCFPLAFLHFQPLYNAFCALTFERTLLLLSLVPRPHNRRK